MFQPEDNRINREGLVKAFLSIWRNNAFSESLDWTRKPGFLSVPGKLHTEAVSKDEKRQDNKQISGGGECKIQEQCCYHWSQGRGFSYQGCEVSTVKL